MKTPVLSEKDLNILTILEYFYQYEWWKSSVTNRRSIFPPNTIPRSDTEWFLERSDKSESLVFDFNIKAYPDFYNDISAAFDLLNILRKKYNTGFTLCDFTSHIDQYKLELVDLNVYSIRPSIQECVASLALFMIKAIIFKDSSLYCSSAL